MKTKTEKISMTMRAYVYNICWRKDETEMQRKEKQRKNVYMEIKYIYMRV